MKIETSKLEGAALDWAVASIDPKIEDVQGYSPSTDWSQGGPIIDSYLIEFRTQAKGCKVLAWAAHEPNPSEGPTHLIAAMRALVMVELGDAVDVPDELLEGA